MTNDTLKLDRSGSAATCPHRAGQAFAVAGGWLFVYTDDLLDVLLGVAANRGTVEAVCATWSGRQTPKRFAAISKTNCG